MSTIPPPAPRGFLAIREAVSDNTQVTHLTPANPSDHFLTLCGLRRFDTVVDGRVVDAADITWTTTNGLTGPGVAQAHCSACWDAYAAAAEIEQLEQHLAGGSDVLGEIFSGEFELDLTDEGHAVLTQIVETAPTGRQAEAIAAGMTPREAEVWDLVASAAGRYLRLTEDEPQHGMEREEVCHAFHVIQGWLAGRPFIRAIESSQQDAER